MKVVVVLLFVCSAHAFSLLALFGSRTRPEASDAVASWTLSSEVHESSPTALAVISRLQERLQIVRGTPCMRDATIHSFVSPCTSASEDELRAFAVSVTNCHLAASGRPTYERARDMDEGAFNAYTLFYSNARDICREMQASVVASQQEQLARELTVVAQKTAAEMADVRDGFVAMGAVLHKNQATIELAAEQARVGFQELQTQGAKTIEETRDGFKSVSAQVQETHKHLELVARGSAEASAKTEELAQHLLRAHEIQKQLLQTQQMNLEAMSRAVEQAFGSTTYLVAVAWYTAVSVATIVLTSFAATSHARPVALALIVVTGFCEYATREAAFPILAEGILRYVRFAGAATAVSSIAVITIWRSMSGRPFIEDDEERFIRILARYLACKP